MGSFTSLCYFLPLKLVYWQWCYYLKSAGLKLMASHCNHILVIMKWLGEVLVKSKFKAAVALSSYKKKPHINI